MSLHARNLPTPPPPLFREIKTKGNTLIQSKGGESNYSRVTAYFQKIRVSTVFNHHWISFGKKYNPALNLY